MKAIIPVLLLVIGALLFFASNNSPSPVPPTPKPDQPPVPVVVDEKKKPTPEQCWNALADCVEKNWIGGETQQHTDHIIKIAESLKTSGSIPDTSRVEQWRTKRIDITDANRAEIARQLRGK